ncbi:MAG: YdcF family protein [Bacteroidales bacterium]|nr:YdcF family protein [Bacteroidales bacterium]
MFFILSKILMFLITPIVWIITLLFFSLFSKNRKKKKRYLLISLLLLLFFSNSFILDEFMRLWEVKATKYNNLKSSYDYGIVLGGITEEYDFKNDRLTFMRSSDRLWQALELYEQKRIKKIIITGGSGSILQPKLKESIFIKQFLLKLNIPEEDIIIETDSRNTRENAVNIARILENKNTDVLLITSAFHMRRSMKCFKKAGIIVYPYSTDRYSGPRKFVFDHLFIPNVKTFSTWNLLIHEIAGYIIYAMVGYI